MKDSLKIYSDGGARGNPGPSASAFVVFEYDKILHKENKYFENKTNNQAEYLALLMAVQWLVKSKIRNKKLNFYLDSELVVNQMKGIYKVKNDQLKRIFLKIKNLEGELLKNNNNLLFTSVKREFNSIADKLVNQAIDENLKNFT